MVQEQEKRREADIITQIIYELEWPHVFLALMLLAGVWYGFHVLPGLSAAQPEKCAECPVCPRAVNIIVDRTLDPTLYVKVSCAQQPYSADGTVISLNYDSEKANDVIGQTMFRHTVVYELYPDVDEVQNFSRRVAERYCNDDKYYCFYHGWLMCRMEFVEPSGYSDESFALLQQDITSRDKATNLIARMDLSSSREDLGGSTVCEMQTDDLRTPDTLRHGIESWVWGCMSNARSSLNDRMATVKD